VLPGCEQGGASDVINNKKNSRTGHLSGMEQNSTLHILVVDDESSVRDVVTQVLEDDGHTVTSVDSAEAALEQLPNSAMQLIISDIRMKEMDGIELLEKVKEINPEIEVVIMTSHASLETSVKALREGAFDYIFKPFDDLDVISTMVNRVAEKIAQEAQRQQTVDTLKTLSEEVLNRLHVGVVLVDAACTSLLANDNAEALLSGKSGLFLDKGTLTASTPNVRTELKRLIAEASLQDVELSGQMSVMTVERQPPRLPLTLLISPLRNRLSEGVAGNHQATAMVFVSEENQKIELSAEVLNLLYGLTPAEARLTIALVDGLELEQIANEFNVSLHTLRGHLKSIFRKTGVRRQSELVALILTGPANFSSKG